MATGTVVQFTPEEEARIQAAVEAAQARAREQAIQDEIRNRTLEAEKGTPGKCYY